MMLREAKTAPQKESGAPARALSLSQWGVCVCVCNLFTCKHDVIFACL